MKKFNLIIGTLFIIFFTNYSIGMNSLEENSIPLNSNANSINYWSTDPKIREIQQKMHGSPENAQFEVKQQPIHIDKLTQIITAFINGEKTPTYIVIGLEEDRNFNYTVMKVKEPMENFNCNKLKNNDNGIYKIITEDFKITYCQIINLNGEKIESTLFLKNNEKSDKSILEYLEKGFIFSNNVKALFKNFNFGENYEIKKISKESDIKKSPRIIYQIINDDGIRYFQKFTNADPKEIILKEINSSVNDNSLVQIYNNLKNASSSDNKKYNINIEQAEKLFNINSVVKKVTELNGFPKGDFENGIYEIMNIEGNPEYYQIFNNKKVAQKQNDQKEVQTKKYSAAEKKSHRKAKNKKSEDIPLIFREDVLASNDVLTLSQAKNLFNEVRENPINTNKIKYINSQEIINVKDDNSEIVVSYDNLNKYLEELKIYIEKNTMPGIKFEDHIEVNRIKFNTINSNNESEIVILTISPKPEKTSELVLFNKKHYGRFQKVGQADYGTYHIEKDIEIAKMKLRKKQKELYELTISEDSENNINEIRNIKNQIKDLLENLDKEKTKLGLDLSEINKG